MGRAGLRAGCTAALLAAAAILVTAAPAQAITGGGPAADGAYRFVAKISVGSLRSCTGALVDPQWVITATSCFSDHGGPVAAGAPAQPATVTVGRAALSGTGGVVAPVVQLVPHPDRGVTLAKLPLRTTVAAPVAVSATPAAVGDV